MSKIDTPSISRIKKIIFTAILLALLIVLSRFLSVKTPIMKLSFGFIPTMICATWLGPKWTILLNVIADLIGATLFPSGAFFIGYTISTAIAGAIYGFLMYRKDSLNFNYKKYLLKVILATVLVAVVVNLGLNTLWTSITSGQAFQALFVGRMFKNLITVPVHIVIFLAIELALRKPLNNILYDIPASTDSDEAKADSDVDR